MKRAIVGAIVLAACSLAPAARAQVITGPAYPYPYSYGYDSVTGLMRIEVDRKDAEVYIDGYYAGIVDDFDGTFQRLHATPGGHQIVIRLDGYRSITIDAYLRPNVVYHIRKKLEPLDPGESLEPRPVPANPGPNPAGGPATAGAYPNGPRRQPAPRGSEPRAPEPRAPQPQAPEPRAQEAPPDDLTSGSLVLRVQPDDADILIDGRHWDGPEGDERLVVQLPEGSHRVEIRKGGYATYTTDVDIRHGETIPLNVVLSQAGE